MCGETAVSDFGGTCPVAVDRPGLGLPAEVTNGKRIEFYDDGTVKAEGGMKDGQLHGKWRWYRKDGTLMRTGQLRAGEPVGTWETWDAAGRLVKRTPAGG